MSTRRVALVFGTRPEAIKLAPLVLALRAHPGIACEVCVTAQHREMLDQVLEAFSIVPDADLDLMRPGQSLGALTARAIAALDGYLRERQPDLVVVQGDTTTTFCAALSAFYLGIPVAHVEAGLRTFDLRAPWPEEANRVLTSRLVTLHFAPTPRSRDNLLREGVPGGSVHVTGNTVIDALLLAREKVRRAPPEVPGLPRPVVESWGDAPVVLVTGHRRESFGSGFEAICRAIALLAAERPHVQFVYPVHLNPNVQEPVRRILGSGGLPNVHLIEPVPYLPFVALLDRATVVLTDSGGIQEEAPSLATPVLVMRGVTERPEAVEAGTALLVGADYDGIIRGVRRLLDDRETYEAMARAHNPFGDGTAAARIAAVCAAFLGVAAPTPAEVSDRL